MPHPNGILKLDCKSGLFFLKIITERQVGTYCTNLETTLIAAKIANEPTKEPYKPNAKVIIPVIIIAIYGTSFEFLFAAIFIQPIEIKVPAPTKYFPTFPIVLSNAVCIGATSVAKSFPKIPIAIPMIAT